MIREEFIERAIRQIVEVAARLIGLVRLEEVPDIEPSLDHLYELHLGLPRSVLSALDSTAAARLLGARVPIAVQLLRSEAELRRAAGRLQEAEALDERALTLEAD